MTLNLNFLIVDGYARASRCELEDAGCSTARGLDDYPARDRDKGITTADAICERYADLPGIIRGLDKR